MKKITIIGAGGHAVSVCNVATSAGFEVQCFVDDNKPGERLLGYEIVSLQDMPLEQGMHYAIGIGANYIREKVLAELTGHVSVEQYPALVHESAVICMASQVGHGSVIMPQSVVGPSSRVGRFCILNTASAIDHDCVMDDFASLGPAAVCGGQVHIKERSAVCIAASIKHGTHIGQDVVVGANAYVNADLNDMAVYYGTPAKRVRPRGKFDSYL